MRPLPKYCQDKGSVTTTLVRPSAYVITSFANKDWRSPKKFQLSPVKVAPPLHQPSVSKAPRAFLPEPSHLQNNLNAFDFISGSHPYRTGHQPVQALLPESGRFAFQKKIPLPGWKDGAVVYGLYLFAHGLWFYGVTTVIYLPKTYPRSGI